MNTLGELKRDTRGDAVVEAAILFPILMMIFCALVILAMYLPARSLLQRATQYAATALAAERSDTWLTYDETAMQYKIAGKNQLPNVYVAVFRSAFEGKDSGTQSGKIVKNIEGESIQSLAGEETRVECQVTNYIFYKEISITATRNIPSPINLSFIGFPKYLPVTVTSTAVVQDGDEFVRNMDIAKDVFQWLDDKYNISEMFSKVTAMLGKISEFLEI